MAVGGGGGGGRGKVRERRTCVKYEKTREGSRETFVRAYFKRHENKKKRKSVTCDEKVYEILITKRITQQFKPRINVELAYKCEISGNYFDKRDILLDIYFYKSQV